MKVASTGWMLYYVVFEYMEFVIIAYLDGVKRVGVVCFASRAFKVFVVYKING